MITLNKDRKQPNIGHKRQEHITHTQNPDNSTVMKAAIMIEESYLSYVAAFITVLYIRLFNSLDRTEQETL